MNTPKNGIDTCAMLVELAVSSWTARKLDRKTTDEVVHNAEAKAKDAARVNKNLLAGRGELDVITQLVGRVRTYMYDHTLPWSDSGLRLLPTRSFMTFNKRMADFEEEFDRCVDDFVLIYPTLITAQAMALGTMFKREDFPTADTLKAKFQFRCNYMPVPAAGDFRVDVGNAAQQELKEALERVSQERVNAAMADIRERMADHLKRMSDRLTTDVVAGVSKGRRFHDTLVDGALELCDLTKGLNVVGDAHLEGARRELEQLLVGVTPAELRKNEAVREDVKQNVDALLSKYNW